MWCWANDLSSMRDRFGDRIGIIDNDGTHSIADVIDRAAGIANHLRASGYGVGDFIATVFHNSALAVAASYAVSLIGAAEVPINPVLSQVEVEHALSCTAARVVLADGRALPVFGLPVPVEDVRQIEKLPYMYRGWPDVEPDAPSRIVFTSGTTGPAKGAIHTHRGRWTGTLLLRASLPFHPDNRNRILLMTPFSHGSSLLTFAYLAQGASVHMMQGVDPAAVLPLLAGGDITEMFAPPTVLVKLTESAAKQEFSALRPKLSTILTGTAPLTPLAYRNAVEHFGDIIRVTYGKSEIFNPITILESHETSRVYARSTGEGLCVGWPAPGVRIEIRNEDGDVLPRGVSGLIHLHSQHMFAGYITRSGMQIFDPELFHDTGDVGYVDAQGLLYLQARDSDMIKSGGYKISPHEIEEWLASALPEAELVVLGYPSEYWGEIVTVVAQSPPSDWQERLEQAMADMTAYKRPRLFATVAEIPRNAIGKISRVQLKRWLTENYDFVEKPKPVFIAKNNAARSDR